MTLGRIWRIVGILPPWRSRATWGKKIWGVNGAAGGSTPVAV
jgi:hypothetical protein